MNNESTMCKYFAYPTDSRVTVSYLNNDLTITLLLFEAESMT